VKLRAAPSAIATFIVAIVVALTVPISQLRTDSVTITCCCPDPAHCHCPHDKPGPTKCPSLKACHQERHDVVSPDAPSFTSPEVAIAIALPRTAPAPFVAPGVPHAEPFPSEPYGPS
jgi:hypothetical protein